MEDILASIKRIIAEDSDTAGARSPRVRKGPVAVPDPETGAFEPELAPATPGESEPEPETHEPSDVLELTSPLIEPYEEPAMAPAEPVSAAASIAAPAAAKPGEPAASILSAPAETASRNAFAALSQLQVRSETGQENTLEGLVADLLRPMLRRWLDANLPAIVERIVEAEVKRVSGRS